MRPLYRRLAYSHVETLFLANSLLLTFYGNIGLL